MPPQSRVAELLMAQGQNAARAREQSGAIWGGAVNQLAQVPQQIVAQRAQERRQQQEDQTRAMQQQQAQQQLAIGAEHLQSLQDTKLDEALTAQLVHTHSSLDPETGHLITDHQAVTEGLTAKGRMQASERYTDFATKNEERINTIQNQHLQVEHAKQQWRAESLGWITELPEDQQPAAYATMRGTLGALAKQDPILGQLPPVYPGKEQLKGIYESQRTEAQRLAAHKEAAAERKASLQKLTPGETLVDVGAIDPATGKPAVIAEGAPKPKHYEQKSVLLDGKPAEVHFDPDTGKHYDASGADVSAHVRPIPPQASIVMQQTASDAKEIADSIVRGEQPPDVKGLYRNAGPVRAQLARQGYDLTHANLDWQATQRHVATLNNSQQTRLRQSINTASASLDVIDTLAQKWDAGRFPLLNKANLALAKQGVYGKDAASIATQLEGQITDVTSELGNVYMGGNSPTDHALQLAGKNLSANWDKKVLLDMTELARTNLRIRNNSMLNVGVAGLSGGPAAAPAGAPSGPSRVYYDKDGNPIKQ